MGVKRDEQSEITLRVHIKTTSGQSFLIELNPKWDIARVKQFVAPKVGLKPDQISIIFAGRDLSDDLLIQVCATDMLRHFNTQKFLKCRSVTSASTVSFMPSN